MSMTSVTVYIPTRNRARFLPRAVASVLQQTHRDLEIVVVDDASEDDTADVVQRLIAANTGGIEINYFRLDRQSGACAARNLAIARAKGHYITGLDDDDYFAPDRIARLVEAFNRHPGAFVFDGYVREAITAGGRIRHTRVKLSKPAQLDDLLKRNIVGNQVLTLTERLRNVGGFDPALPAWQDYDLWLRLVKAFGPGMPAGGLSYFQTVNAAPARISTDAANVRSACGLFVKKHREYSDPRLRLFPKLAMACYGIDALDWRDMAGTLALGEPRIVAASFYFYLMHKLARG